MTNTSLETVPQTWDDQRDNDFFRIVASLFSPDFVYGAGVLLAGNDSEFDDITPVVASDVEYAFVVPVTA
jgi:hypothetical protein